MTEINVILINLAHKIREQTNKRVFIMDAIPATVQQDCIYIVAPSSHGISTKHMMGGGSFASYRIAIYEITHVMDANRQEYLDSNIGSTYNKVDSLLHKCFDGFKKDKKIFTANIYRTEYGTSSWVVNTKVYTAYNVTLYIKDIIED